MLYQNVFYLLLQNIQNKYFEFQGNVYNNNNNLERVIAPFYFLFYIQHCLYY
jgi:hypothetical protein